MGRGARGGGVGVGATAGDLLGGAGEADDFSKVTTSPLLGFLMTTGALFFFGGIWKFVAFGAGLLA